MVYRAIILLFLYNFTTCFALSIFCLYSQMPFAFLNIYNCKGTIDMTDGIKDTVTSISGVHISGKSNTDVEGLELIAQGLEYFPRNIEVPFPNLKRIDVTSNTISSIVNNQLRPHKYLEDLNFTGNNVTNLESKLFDGLSKMMYASFSYNNVRHVGSDITLPSSAVYFQKNPCIDMYGVSVVDIVLLKNALKEKCPPLIIETTVDGDSSSTHLMKINLDLELRLAALEKLLREKLSESNCVRSLTQINNNNPCQDTIIFEDDFDSFNESKWLKVKRFSGEPDFEFVVYIPKADVLYTQNGILYIQPKRLESEFGENAHLLPLDLGLNCTGDNGNDECQHQRSVTITPPMISSQITTGNTFNFLYGKVEIRAKLPSEDWVFPQLFLESSHNYYGKGNFKSGQMRIAFTKGKIGLLSGGVLLGSSEPTRSSKMCIYPNNLHLSDEFHIFSLKWTPDEIVVAVDGREYCQINSKANSPFDKEFHLTFGIGIGGINDFSDDIPNKPWRNTQVKAMKRFWDIMKPLSNWPNDKSALLVDYVRVYSL